MVRAGDRVGLTEHTLGLHCSNKILQNMSATMSPHGSESITALRNQDAGVLGSNS